MVDHASEAEIVLMGDPRIAGIAVRECGQDLVDGRAGGALLVADLYADEAGAYAQMRADVLERLVHADRALPAGIRLLLVEGYRPPALQRQYFDEYRDGLRAENPAWDAERLDLAASRYVSPPSIAPHTAGAAIDLTLCTEDGEQLDLGTRINADPEESAGACYTAHPGLPAEARHHRAVLGTAMAGAGFVNYPTEWWHWSYGDRYWALVTGAPTALYGPRDWQPADR
jgi:D-alanyl-D-alanine dipeptidase